MLHRGHVSHARAHSRGALWKPVAEDSLPCASHMRDLSPSGEVINFDD